MHWAEVFTIIGVLGALMIYSLQRLEKDIDGSNRRLDGHAQRIDTLYKMFVDLLKDKNS
jgi:hypothetical protein